MAKKQREIKFRMWDKKKKVLLYLDNIWNLAENIIGKYHKARVKTWDLRQGHLLGKNIVLMQFTGLLDKQGKEIYEGDIIEMTDSPSNYMDKGDEIKTHWEVVFDRGSFYLENGEKEYSDFEDCYGGEIFLGNSWKYGEIIGNIYESKYLLDNIDTKNPPNY